MKGSARRKPLELHVHDPKKHLTAEDKEDRADAEVTMGEVKFIAPEEIKKNKKAYVKWREITKIYRDSGLELVTSTDTGVLSRYCMLWADWLVLIEHRDRLEGFEYKPDDMCEILALTEAEYHRERASRLWGIVEYFTSLEGILKLDDKINRKCEAILKIEDRIFLNPASKVRTLPIKRKQTPKDKLGDMGFEV